MAGALQDETMQIWDRPRRRGLKNHHGQACILYRYDGHALISKMEKIKTPEGFWPIAWGRVPSTARNYNKIDRLLYPWLDSGI